MRGTIAGLSAAAVTAGLLASCNSPPPPTPSQRFATSMGKVGLYPKHGQAAEASWAKSVCYRIANAVENAPEYTDLNAPIAASNAAIGAWWVVIDDGLIGRAAARRCPTDSRISSDPEASSPSPAINGCVHLDAWTWLPESVSWSAAGSCVAVVFGGGALAVSR